MGLWLFGGFYKFRIRLLWRTTLDIHDTQWSTNLPRCSFFYNSTKSCMIFLTLSQQVKKTKYSMDRNTKRDRRRRRTKRENEHVPWKNLVLLSSMALRPVYHFPQKVGFLTFQLFPSTFTYPASFQQSTVFQCHPLQLLLQFVDL